MERANHLMKGTKLRLWEEPTSYGQNIGFVPALSIIPPRVLPLCRGHRNRVYSMRDPFHKWFQFRPCYIFQILQQSQAIWLSYVLCPNPRWATISCSFHLKMSPFGKSLSNSESLKRVRRGSKAFLPQKKDSEEDPGVAASVIIFVH